MKTVTYNGKTLTLKQDAFISDDGLTYEAVAYEINAEDEEVLYKIKWDIIEYDNNTEIAEDEACDWDKYTVIEL